MSADKHLGRALAEIDRALELAPDASAMERNALALAKAHIGSFRKAIRARRSQNGVKTNVTTN